MDQPLKANFFPGILEGLAGRLGLMPPGVADPPTSAKTGVYRRWAAALREAVIRTEGRDIDLEQVTHNVMPPGLHLDYGLDFLTRRVDDIAPTLTSPLLSGLVSNICQLQKPEIPGKPVSFKADEGLWGHGRAPAKPGAPGPSHNGGMVPKMQAGEGEAPENKPHDQGESNQDQPISEPDPEEVAGVIISDDEEIDLTIDVPQAASTPKSEPALSQKRSLEDRSPHTSPSKKRATGEEEKSTPPWEAALPRGVKKEEILPKRYETFTADNSWVQRVRCSLLGLEAGTTPSREDIATSEPFIPQAAASESDLPEVITDLLAAHPLGRRPFCRVSPRPVHCYSRLGPPVHSGRLREVSSCGSILLYKHRATAVNSHSTSRVPRGHRQGVPVDELPPAWVPHEAVIYY